MHRADRTTSAVLTQAAGSASQQTGSVTNTMIAETDLMSRTVTTVLLPGQVDVLVCVSLHFTVYFALYVVLYTAVLVMLKACHILITAPNKSC